MAKGAAGLRVYHVNFKSEEIQTKRKMSSTAILAQKNILNSAEGFTKKQV